MNPLIPIPETELESDERLEIYTVFSGKFTGKPRNYGRVLNPLCFFFFLNLVPSHYYRVSGGFFSNNYIFFSD